MKMGKINKGIIHNEECLGSDYEISNEILDDISDEILDISLDVSEMKIKDLDSFSFYLKEIGQHKLMTNEEMVYYGKLLLKGDQLAKEKFITHNLKYVIKVAKERLPVSPLGIEELVSSGNLGLISAAESYDYRKTKFITYAHDKIWAAMIRDEENNSRTIRIPVYMVQKRNKVNRSIEKLTKTLDRTPSIEEISVDTGFCMKDVKKAMDASIKMYSVDTMVGSDLNDEGGDYLQSEYDLESDCLSKERNNIISIALSKLSEDERNVIKLRFFEREDHKNIGEILNMEISRVKSIEKHTMAKLKNAFLDLGIDTASLLA